MECKQIEELLSPYLEGELAPDENRTVEAHLQTCTDCSELLGLMREAQKSLADFPEIDVSADLLEKLYTLPAKKSWLRSFSDFLLRPALQPVFTAATIVMIMFSFYYFHPERSQINKSIDRQLHIGYKKIQKIYADAESFTGTLGEYKDNLLVSIKNIKLFGEKES
jgi:hypothetical protein